MVLVAHPNQDLAVVDPTVRRIALQFSFSNPAVAPLCVRDFPAETLPEHRDRIRRAEKAPTGQQFIDRVPRVDITQFVDTLPNHYRLVDAAYQARIHRKNPRPRFNMVRFVFVRPEHAFPQPEFDAKQERVFSALLQMGEDALWRVRAYRNPLVVQGELVPDEVSISLNFEVRSPHRGSREKQTLIYTSYDYCLQLLQASGNRLRIALTNT